MNKIIDKEIYIIVTKSEAYCRLIRGIESRWREIFNRSQVNSDVCVKTRAGDDRRKVLQIVETVEKISFHRSFQ